jgi:hypothetical protein
MVCKSGYQEGAKEYAQGYGILLYELREMRDEDRIGRIRTISLRFAALAPRVSEFTPNADRTWLKEQKQAHSIPEAERIEIVGYAGELFLEREDGTRIGTMAGVFDKYLPEPLASMPQTRIEHNFASPVFIPTRRHDLTRLKLVGFG